MKFRGQLLIKAGHLAAAIEMHGRTGLLGAYWRRLGGLSFDLGDRTFGPFFSSMAHTHEYPLPTIEKMEEVIKQGLKPIPVVASLTFSDERQAQRERFAADADEADRAAAQDDPRGEADR